eukprot:scaffold23655_cov65-Phaeocystis_antarctica.AAC.8
MEIVHSDGPGGGYDDREEGSVESFAQACACFLILSTCLNLKALRRTSPLYLRYEAHWIGRGVARKGPLIQSS